MNGDNADPRCEQCITQTYGEHPAGEQCSPQTCPDGKGVFINGFDITSENCENCPAGFFLPTATLRVPPVLRVHILSATRLRVATVLRVHILATVQIRVPPVLRVKFLATRRLRVPTVLRVHILPATRLHVATVLRVHILLKARHRAHPVLRGLNREQKPTGARISTNVTPTVQEPQRTNKENDYSCSPSRGFSGKNNDECSSDSKNYVHWRSEYVHDKTE